MNIGRCVSIQHFSLVNELCLSNFFSSFAKENNKFIILIYPRNEKA